MQLWDRSTWWRDGDAVVGLLDLPGSPVPVVYAVAADHPAATRDLLLRIVPTLPERLIGHLPAGATAALSPTHEVVWHHDYRKMALARPEALPPDEPAVLPLGADDLDDVVALFATDPRAGDFFHPGLLDTGWYLGRRIDGALAAVAGVHVVEPSESVAALGNIATHPGHRRRGLGRQVVASLCHRLADTTTTIGLNVRAANGPARRLYEHLGFVEVARYEEVEVHRRW